MHVRGVFPTRGLAYSLHCYICPHKWILRKYVLGGRCSALTVQLGLVMMLGPSKVEDAQKEVAGTFMVCELTVCGGAQVAEFSAGY